jgi:heat shock protein HtpX
MGLIVMAVSGTVALMFTPRVSPRLALRFFNARVLSPQEAPGLHRLVRELADRAGIEKTPEIFHIRSAAVNAFSVGSGSRSAVAVSDGLLRSMNTREIAGILAHEMSHVRSGDMWVMGLAEVMSRMTSTLSLLGLVLLLINLPLMLAGDWTISWWLILILIFSPHLATMLQLGLSRSREFNADMEAARITGDPQGLASALNKLHRAETGLLARLLMPGRNTPSPMRRTHPDTGERVRRLLELSARRPARETSLRGENLAAEPAPPRSHTAPLRRPRRGLRL